MASYMLDVYNYVVLKDSRYLQKMEKYKILHTKRLAETNKNLSLYLNHFCAIFLIHLISICVMVWETGVQSQAESYQRLKK